MTGRLEGTLFGRPVAIEAGDGQLRLMVDSLRSAWKLRKYGATTLVPLLNAIMFLKLDFRLQVGSIEVKILPKPAMAVRWLVPAVHQITLEN